jgi:hypothetical protein
MARERRLRGMLNIFGDRFYDGFEGFSRDLLFWAGCGFYRFGGGQWNVEYRVGMGGNSRGSGMRSA